MNKISFITRLIKQFDPILELPKWGWLRKALEKLDLKSDDFFFVQIGSNDGVIHDPLFQYINRYRWKGILVEPIDYYFERLKANYKDNPQLLFENVAISEKQEIRDFYRVKEELDFLPAWSKGLGTFYPQVLLKHRWLIPKLKNYIVKERVSCISLKQLFERHRVEKIDLLMIDTEGYDSEIIKQLDFDTIKPSIIIYEHKHLKTIDKKTCELLLEKQEYFLSKHFSNTMATLLHK